MASLGYLNFAFIRGFLLSHKVVNFYWQFKIPGDVFLSLASDLGNSQVSRSSIILVQKYNFGRK